MTQIARLYGSSMYDLAAEEQLTDTVLEQMQTIRQLFRENPDYVKLLSEPSIPKEERTKLLDTAFGTEAERYLVNFLKLLCERGILGEYSGCCEEFTRRYNVDHNIALSLIHISDYSWKDGKILSGSNIWTAGRDWEKRNSSGGLPEKRWKIQYFFRSECEHSWCEESQTFL